MESSIDVKAPDTKELEKETVGILARCEAAIIVTREDYDKWDAYKLEITKAEKGIDVKFDGNAKSTNPDDWGPVVKARKAYESIRELRDELKSRLTPAKQLLSKKLGEWWEKDQERIRKEQIEAEEKARKAEAERLKKEGAKKTEIKNVLNGNTAIPLPPTRTQPPTIGRKPVEYYKAQTVDLMALVKGVASGKVPIGAIKPNDVFLNGQAFLLKSSLNYPGVKVIKEVRA